MASKRLRLSTDTWAILLSLTLALIVRIGGGRCDASEARLKTLSIVGQALVFRVARATLLRVTGWTDVDPDGAAAIRRIVRAHTIAILTSTCGDLAP